MERNDGRNNRQNRKGNLTLTAAFGVLLAALMLSVSLSTGSSFLVSGAEKAKRTESEQEENRQKGSRQEAYRFLAGFQTEGWQQKSVAEFYRLLLGNDAGISGLDSQEGSERLGELLNAYCEVVNPGLPEGADPSFFKLTLWSSLSELYSELMKEETCFLGTTSRKERPIGLLPGEKEELKEYLEEGTMSEQEYQELSESELWNFELIFSAGYALVYTMPDPEQITIAERDEVFQTFDRELQAYVDSLSEAELTGEGLKQKLTEEADRLAQKLSNEKISCSCRVERIELNFCGEESEE